MAQLTMNRCIHAAVLRDLDRIEQGLRQVRDGDKERLADLQRAFVFLQGQLTRHHEGEDDHIWPMLTGKGVEGALLESMVTEHKAMAAALKASRVRVDAAAASGSAAEAASAADSLAETRTVTAAHLTHEEVDVEPMIRPHVESAEWKAVEKELRKGPPTQAGQFFAWLLDGASPEINRFVRTLVPGPVIFVLTKVFGRGYTKEIAPVWRR